MATKVLAVGVCFIALAAASALQHLYYGDLSVIENLYTILAYLMARPQYLLHLNGIKHFRERSDAAMVGFVMRESQAVAFRASLTLEASYKSYFEEDGNEAWAAAPRNPLEVLSYEEVYVQRKLQPPTDPESVIIDRPHSFSAETPPQLLPPHPLHAPPPLDSDKTQNAQKTNTIGLHIYTPVTCSTAPDLPSSSSEASASCKEFHQQLYYSTRKAEKIKGILSFEMQAEAMNVEGLQEAAPQAEYPKQRSPVLFFLHGGGLVGLSTAAYDKLIRRMTNLFGAIDGVVISIDYRLSPEHKFPIPMEDCLHAINFVVNHADQLGVDGSKIALIGDSAGGALVISVLGEALRLPEKYPWARNVLHASLVYPSLCRGCPTRSHLLYGTTHTLKSDIWFAFSHTPTIGPVWDWRQMPFAIPSNILSQFPSTSLVLFTHDIQYETGVLFHERLRRAGVSTSLFIAPGMHAFFGSDCWSSFGVQTVEWAIQRIIKNLNKPPLSQHLLAEVHDKKSVEKPKEHTE